MAPVLIAIGQFIMAHTTAYIWITNIIQWAVVAAAANAYSNSQRAKARRQAEALRQQGRSVMVRDPASSRVAIYGEIKVSGTIPFMHTTGTKNEYLHIVLVLAGHELEEISTIYFGSEEVPLDGSGNATGTFAGHARVKKFLGISAGERDTDLESESGGVWTSDHLGKGIARLHVRLKWNVDVFPQGIPNIQALVRGKKVRDYRNDSYTKSCATTSGSTTVTCADVSSLSVGMRVEGDGIPYAAKITSFGGGGFVIDIPATKTAATVSLLIYAVAWSMNSALCIADYLNDPVIGRGVHSSRIKTDDVIEAANICDESVVLADATSEYRYMTNGIVTSDQGPGEVLDDLAAAMAGCVVDTGGTWHIRAGAWRTPTVTLTDSDLVGPFTVQPRLSRQDTFNRVRGLYYSPQNQWAPTDFPAVKNTTYKESDGGVWLDKDLTLPFTTSPATAQRLAKIDLERNRQQIVVTSQWNLKAMQCMPGDVVAITRSRLGWSSKYFEVIEWGFAKTGDDENPALGISMTLRETAAAVWDWADGEETTVDLAPNTTLPDPWTVPTPSGVTATSGSTTVIVQPDGTAVPRVLLAWNTPNNIHVESGGKTHIDYKPSAGGTWYPWMTVNGSTLSVYVTDVHAGVSFDFRVCFENNAGVRGAYATVTGHTVVGDITAPSALSAPSVTAHPGFNRVAWSKSADDDTTEYKVYRNTSATTSGATTWETPGLEFDDPTSTPGSTYYYAVAPIDGSENGGLSNISGWTSVVTSLAPVGAAVPSSPTAATRVTPGTDDTYMAGDGTMFAFITMSVAALSTNGVWQNLLYRRNGATEWLVAAQLKNTGSVNVRIDDLTPGVSYEVGTQVWSGAGGSAVTTATSSPFTAPVKTGAPATPTGGALSPNGVVPKFIPGTGLFYFGCNVTWDRNTESDFAYYEVKATTTDTDGATDYSWTQGDVGSTVARPTQPQVMLYNELLPAGYVRVRAVNRSGAASAWLRIGNINSGGNVSIGVGSIAAQNSNDVRTSGIKTGAAGASSVRKVLAVHPVNDVYSLSGGAPTEKFNVSLTNRGFGTKPDKAAGSPLAMSDNNIIWRYDWDDASSTSTNAVIEAKTLDGTNISAGSYRFSFDLLEYD